MAVQKFTPTVKSLETVVGNLIPAISAYPISTESTVAVVKSSFIKFAYEKLVPVTSAPEKFALVRIEPKKSAPRRSTLVKFGELNVNEGRLAFSRFAPGPTR